MTMIVEPHQTFMMDLFCENSLRLFAVFLQKSFIKDNGQGSAPISCN